MSARFLLGDAFLENIVHILPAKSLLEALFAGRIYALANKHGRTAELDRVGVGRHDSALLFRERNRGDAFDLLCKSGDIFGSRTAAAADGANTECGEVSRGFGEFLGGDVKDGFVIHRARKSRVGLQYYGDRGAFEILLYNGSKC